MLELGCVIKSAAKILLLSSASGASWAKISCQLSNQLQPDTVVTKRAHIKPDKTIYYCVWHTAMFWLTLGVASKECLREEKKTKIKPSLSENEMLARWWKANVIHGDGSPFFPINNDIASGLSRHYVHVWILWSHHVLLYCICKTIYHLINAQGFTFYLSNFSKADIPTAEQISFPVQILTGGFEKQSMLSTSETYCSFIEKKSLLSD